MSEPDSRRVEEASLLARLNECLPELESILASCNDHWGYEDGVYRFYQVRRNQGRCRPKPA